MLIYNGNLYIYFGALSGCPKSSRAKHSYTLLKNNFPPKGLGEERPHVKLCTAIKTLFFLIIWLNSMMFPNCIPCGLYTYLFLCLS